MIYKEDFNMADLNSIGGLHYEMMKRCYNSKSIMWKYYGEKGIKVPRMA